MTNLGSVYGAGRERLTGLVAGLSEEQFQTTVPACPEWTVHDVLAHLSGICDDILAGNIAGAPGDTWTAEQVAKRKDWSTADILAEWNGFGPQIDPIVDFFPGRVSEQFVYDMHTHEQDIRQALDLPGGRDAAGIEVGAVFAVEVGFLSSLAARGLPPIEIVCGDRRWVSASSLPGDDAADPAAAATERAGAVLTGTAQPVTGDEEPVGSLKTTPWDLFRALTGRRSLNQLRALGWTMDPEPYLHAFQFGPFTIRADDLVE
jgi:uncharacterized protein (TIGR03083 family)